MTCPEHGALVAAWLPFERTVRGFRMLAVIRRQCRMMCADVR